MSYDYCQAKKTRQEQKSKYFGISQTSCLVVTLPNWMTQIRQQQTLREFSMSFVSEVINEWAQNDILFHYASLNLNTKYFQRQWQWWCRSFLISKLKHHVANRCGSCRMTTLLRCLGVVMRSHRRWPSLKMKIEIVLRFKRSCKT